MNDFSESKFAWKGPFDKASVRLATSTRQTPIGLDQGVPPTIELEIPISQLPLAGPLFGDEMVAVVQNGITSRSTAAIVGGSGQAPVFIYKTMQLVYAATIGQTLFSLSDLDHYGNFYGLTDANALQVTVGGIRMIVDDGTGTWGQYTVNVLNNSVTLLTPFGTDPVVIVGDGDVVIFDIFSLSAPPPGPGPGPGPGPSPSVVRLYTQPMMPLALNTLPFLLLTPDGTMLTMFVNGRAFSNVSIPPSFSVSGRAVTWIDPDYAVTPTDEVVITYSYASTASTTGSFLLYAQPLTLTAPNTFPNLTFPPDGQMTIMYVNGRAFSPASSPPAFTVVGTAITWFDPHYSVNPTDEVVINYTYGGSDGALTESLTLTSTNVFPHLSSAPDGQMTVVYVNGLAFSDQTSPPDFSVSGTAITWLNLSYSVNPTDEVVACYTKGFPGAVSSSQLQVPRRQRA